MQLNRTVFNATTVYQCLTSVPFNGAISSRFIRYYNDTLQFHSTLGYLKQPPAEYQQPATDLIAGLGRIQQAINDNLFPNQYSFEATLQQLIYSAHDAHVQLVSGALAAFKFAAPFEIVSVSKDGIELPKVYIFCKFILLFVCYSESKYLIFRQPISWKTRQKVPLTTGHHQQSHTSTVNQY